MLFDPGFACECYKRTIHNCSIIEVYLFPKESHSDRGHDSDENGSTGDSELEIVLVKNGKRTFQDVPLDLDMPCDADTIKQERVQSEESGESDSEHSSVDDDNRNPFKG